MITTRKNATTITRVFEDDGYVPNSRLPLVIYGQLLDLTFCPKGEKQRENAMEGLIKKRGWYVDWTYSIFKREHYHPNAHEALAIVKGAAKIQCGGRRAGETFEVAIGDAIIIPAGVGHERLESSDDFTVIGMYVKGAKYETYFGTKAEYVTAKRRLPHVVLPPADPFYGSEGIMKLWK